MLCCAVLCCAVLTGCVEDSSSNLEKFSELNILEQKFIWDPEGWDDICYSTFCLNWQANNFGTPSSTFLKPATYSKAVADLSVASGTGSAQKCSGFLVDNEWLVTARHCSINAGWSNSNPNMTLIASFGRYGGSNYNLGVVEARHRFRQWIGLSDSALPDTFFTDFTCYYNSSSFTSGEGYRDIHYYWCAPKNYLGVDVYPGDLYGHLNSEIRMLSEGETIFSASAQVKNIESSSSTFWHNLISDGSVYDADDSCAFGESYENCFETIGDDSICGSSGGLIMTDQGRAIGVIKANAHHAGYTPPGGTDSCNRTLQDTSDGYWISNRQTYLTSRINNVFANTTPVTSATIINPPWTQTAWVGGPNGAFVSGTCPDKYYAAGVIGSTANNGNVGNFGIVCVPMRISYSTRELDRAVVITGGSIGTQTGAHINIDLNTYYNEYLSNESGAYTGVHRFKHQNVHMCQPGYGLYGLKLRTDNNRILKVEAIQCRDFKPFGNSDYVSYQNGYNLASDNTIGKIINTGYSTYATCDSGTIVRGIELRSGWETDAVRLRCQAY